jgi:hypothetical protein
MAFVRHSLGGPSAGDFLHAQISSSRVSMSPYPWTATAGQVRLPLTAGRSQWTAMYNIQKTGVPEKHWIEE